MEWTFTIEELPQVAQSFWAQYGAQQVFTLEGAMGAGKTTFVKALCAAKGVEDTTASPTFSISTTTVLMTVQHVIFTTWIYIACVTKKKP